jgi:hypothetical protein
MPRVTDFRCVDENGEKVPCDAFGNNVAFTCCICEHPMLAVMLENGRGSKPENLSVCRECGTQGWLEVDSVSDLLTLHWVQDKGPTGVGI